MPKSFADLFLNASIISLSNWCIHNFRLNSSFLTFLGVKMCDKMAISAYIFKASNES